MGRMSDIRVIYDPLIIGADGRLLPPQYIPFGAYFADPLKMDVDEIKTALDQPRSLKSVAAAIGEVPPAQHRVVIKELVRDKPDEAQAVLAHHGQPDFNDRLLGYLDAKHAELKSDPAKTLSLLTAEREYARERDRRRGVTSDKLTYMSPEQRSPYAMARIDPGRAGDTGFEEEAIEVKTKLAGYLDQELEWLKPLRRNKTTVLIVPELLSSQGASAHVTPELNVIAIDAAVLERGKPKVVRNALREEMIHLSDLDSGFSARTDFRAEVDRIMADGPKLATLEAELKIVHQDKKKALSKFDKEHQYAEILTEYFHMREHLNEQPGKGFAAKFTGGKVEMVPATDAKLDALFSPEFARLSQEFERSVKGQGTGAAEAKSNAL